MGLNTIKGTGNWGGAASDLNNNFASITAEIEKLKAVNVKFKGYYTAEWTLKAAHPSPIVGDTAWVGETYPGVVYRCNVAGAWLATTDVPPSNTVDLSEYAAKDAVSREFASVRSDLSEKIEKNAIKQTTGNDPEQVMSQDAVSKEFASVRSDLANNLEQLYPAFPISLAFTQGKYYDSVGNIVDSVEYKCATVDISEFAGTRLYVSPTIPPDWKAKSMIVEENGDIIPFGGTFGGDISIQLSETAKTLKLSQYFTAGDTTVIGYKGSTTTSYEDYLALYNDFNAFKELDSTMLPCVNLFDKATMVYESTYIKPTTYKIDNSGSSYNRVARIPISFGKHVINITKLIDGAYDTISVETEIDTPSIADCTKLSLLPYDETGTGKVLDIINQNAKYILIQVSTSLEDYRDTLQIQTGSIVTAYEPYKLSLASIIGKNARFDFQNALTSIVDYYAAKNPLYKKKLGALGDSITFGYGVANNKRYNRRNTYAVQLAERNNMALNVSAIVGSFVAVLPKGETGTEFVNRWDEIDSDCDYVVIFGCTNDANSTAPIGNDSDTVKTTIKGAYNIICSGLINKIPTAKFLLITPMNYNAVTDTRIKQLCSAIEDIGVKWSIPVLNLYKNGNYAPVIAAQLAVYGVGGNDQYHPNELYHGVLAEKIEKFWK